MKADVTLRLFRNGKEKVYIMFTRETRIYISKNKNDFGNIIIIITITIRLLLLKEII